MKKLHLAIGTNDIDASVADYTQRLGQSPDLVIPNAYALWRTDNLNLSVRVTGSEEVGKVRHLGFEDETATEFTAETDSNGVLWEHFNAEQQRDEILEVWPDTDYQIRPK